MRELQSKWLEALESGKYTQGRSFLKREECGTLKYCCLGVLCEVKGLPSARDTDYFPSTIYKFNNEHVSMLSPHLISEVGLTQEQAVTLAHMNDSDKTFHEIASEIKRIIS